MTTYNTGNPLGSAAAKDLYDNAQNFDHLSNDLENEMWPDRFGKSRLTWHGMEKRYQEKLASMGWELIDSFQGGTTLTRADQALRWELPDGDGEYYRWDGSLPKTVPAGSTPDSTGGVGTGAWVGVGDASLRSALSKSTGAELVNTNSGNNVQESLDILSYSYGVRLSSYMQESDPLTSALAASRNKKLPLVIDCDATYKTFLVYSNDRIIGCGDHTLTKIGNDKPSIPSAQQPERPSGTMTDFSAIDAGIIIVHPDNGAATNIEITGFNIKSNSHSEFGIYLPVLSFSRISHIKTTGFNKGMKSKDSYGNQFSQIFSLYYYSVQDIYSDNYCYDFADGDYASGTSNTFTNVTCTNYKRPFFFQNHNYYTMTNCGGEGVNTHETVTNTNYPLVFEFVNVVSAVLNTPYTENLYGGFLRATSTPEGTAKGPSTIVINGPQAITAIYGTDAEVGAKLFDVSGSVNVTVNGGVLTGASSGKFLKFGGASDEACLLITGMDMKYVLAQIRSDFGYNGINSIKGLRPIQVLRNGIGSATGSGIVNWKSASIDDYFMNGGNYTKTALGGFYKIEITLPIGSSTSGGEVQLLLSDTDTDNGVIISQCYVPPVSSGKFTASISYEGRLPGGKYLYVKTNNASWSSGYDTDTVFNVILK